ncbi:hypothetical protein [Chitinophaga nivalis]|uniref:Uncharacterized protein n=1 Tax=Chitinophaga nivalis TaxID=2991709 RepID=A0ABT3IVR1_9BACT|nr:hypothetical protein [Chitinophaga nivalis]MCW3462236.1 hypothetical protein [Chitinophaga nivalis]MCW3488072.1 hypothetical protein [Chitinophaga nivalis]
MRSIAAFMACIGCIAWLHSCDRRLLGVKPEFRESGKIPLPPVTIQPAPTPQLLPVDVNSPGTTYPGLPTVTATGKITSTRPEKKNNNIRKSNIIPSLPHVIIVKTQPVLINSLTPWVPHYRENI